MSAVPFPSSLFHHPTGFILWYKGRDITLSHLSLLFFFLPPCSLNRFTLSPSFSPSFFPSPRLPSSFFTHPHHHHHHHHAAAFLILPSCLFSSGGDASLAAPMKQVNFLPARRMNKSPWVCSERWGYLSKWSVSSSAQRYRHFFSFLPPPNPPPFEERGKKRWRKQSLKRVAEEKRVMRGQKQRDDGGGGRERWEDG